MFPRGPENSAGEKKIDRAVAKGRRRVLLIVLCVLGIATVVSVIALRVICNTVVLRSRSQAMQCERSGAEKGDSD